MRRTLGDVHEFDTLVGRRKFVVTTVNDDQTMVLTPIPDGMTALDLGRKFPAAIFVRPGGVYDGPDNGGR